MGWAGAQPNPVSPPEKRLALVIGNGSYTQRSAVPQALNNADDLAALLPKLGFDVMLVKNVDKAHMQLAIHQFSTKLKGYQVGLVYYTGHGVQDGENLFLLPVDANPTTAADVGEIGLKTHQLITDMASAKAVTNLILIDSDRDNLSTHSYTRPLGLDLDTPVGFVVAYATRPGKSMVAVEERNSLYTAALLREIVIPNQSVIDVCQHVREEVIKRSNYKQTPWELTSLTSNFYFQRK
ncbi:hypothetical protein GCM10028825_36220 [Spirosoma agri]